MKDIGAFIVVGIIVLAFFYLLAGMYGLIPAVLGLILFTGRSFSSKSRWTDDE